MKRVASWPVLFVLAVALTSSSVILAAPGDPPVEQVVTQAIAATGGPDAFTHLDIVKVAWKSVETVQEGGSHEKHHSALVVTDGLTAMQLHLSDKVILTRNAATAWAMVDGKLDERRTAPYMSKGTIDQQLFPMLLPFSLRMSGVSVVGATADTFEGTPVWRLDLSFEKGFFASPVMTAPWSVFIRKEDGRLLAAQFLPPEEYRKVQTEGVRYRYSKWGKVAGVSLPTQMLVEGIDFNGSPTAHNALFTMDWSQPESVDRTVFIDPKTRERIEEGVPPAPPRQPR